MLLEELDEAGNGDIEGVDAIVELGLLDLLLRLETARLLEVAQQGLRVDRIDKGAKGLGGVVVVEPALLEEKGDVASAAGLHSVSCGHQWRFRISATYKVAFNLANLRRASVLDGNDLDQRSRLDRARRPRSEQGVHVNAPFGDEPCQRLQREYGAGVHEGPFLAIDVLIVAIFR